MIGCAFNCSPISIAASALASVQSTKHNKIKSISLLPIHIVQTVFPTATIAYFEFLHMRPICDSMSSCTQFSNTRTVHCIEFHLFTRFLHLMLLLMRCDQVPIRCRLAVQRHRRFAVCEKTKKKKKCIKHITSIAPATKENICSFVYLQTSGVHSNFIHNHISLTSNSMAKCVRVSWFGWPSMDMTNDWKCVSNSTHRAEHLKRHNMHYILTVNIFCCIFSFLCEKKTIRIRMRKPGERGIERERADEEKINCIWDVFIAPGTMGDELIPKEMERRAERRLKSIPLLFFVRCLFSGGIK